MPQAEVRRVVDGDTLLLDDGRRVRMVGLDAPELGRNGAPDAPLARAARDHLNTLVELGGGRVALRNGPETHDRYGRQLSIVYTTRHGDLAAHLIENGLALVAVVPPNLDALPCHTAAERRARASRMGVWGLDGGPVTPSTALNRTGFAVLRGRAGVWTVRRNDRLLTLDGGVVLRVRDADRERWFGDTDLERYAGALLEVRGWVHPWSGDRRAITVQHPAAIEVMQPLTPDI
ncbi:MAG: thermonuclease family protein [Gammaproteobacteria bacterium]